MIRLPARLRLELMFLDLALTDLGRIQRAVATWRRMIAEATTSIHHSIDTRHLHLMRSRVTADRTTHRRYVAALIRYERRWRTLGITRSEDLRRTLWKSHR